MTISYEEMQDIQQNVEARGQPQDPYAELPPTLAGELATLTPAPNAPARIESLMRQYPDQTNQILAEAARRCGNAAVQRALQLHQDRAGNQWVRDEILNDDMREADAMPSHPNAPAEVAPANTADWNAADHYNTAHPHHVAEFNALTESFAVRDGKIDAAAVSQWQTDRGLAPDGKVGPMTVAAAKQDADSKKAADTDVAPTEPIEEEQFDDLNGSATDVRTYE